MLLIKNGVIVDGYSIFRGDILVEDEKIKDIRPGLSEANCETVIDAADKYIFPGGIDPHVHFQLPFGEFSSVDTFETGTMAAAAGGITTIIDFSTQKPGGSMIDAVAARKAEADSNVCIDYSLHCGIVDGNAACTAADMKTVADMGVRSFKIFTVYRERGMMSDTAAMMNVLKHAKELDAVVGIHAEDEGIANYYTAQYTETEQQRKDMYNLFRSRPQICEETAVHTAAFLIEKMNADAYIVHTSSGGSVDIIRRAQQRGINIKGETCPQYLLLTSDALKQENGSLYTCCPPLKEQKDCDALWLALKNNELEFIGTDTCSFTQEMKNANTEDFRNIPYGLPGVDIMFPLIFSEGVKKEHIDIQQFVRLCSVNAAKYFGLYPEKGSLMPGTDADMVIFDPELQWIVDSSELLGGADWSPYNGMQLRGKPICTILRGNIVAENGTFTGEKGQGRFLKR